MSLIETARREAAKERANALANYRAILNRSIDGKETAEDEQRINELLQYLGRTPDDLARDLNIITRYRRLKALASDQPRREQEHQKLHAHFMSLDVKNKEIVAQLKREHQLADAAASEAFGLKTEADEAVKELPSLIASYPEILGNATGRQ
jgi:hypothetical protein